MVYRVRKLNKQQLIPDARARGRRTRLRDFQEAWRSLKKRRLNLKPTTIYAFKEYNRLMHAPRGCFSIIDKLKDGHTGLIVVPISQAGWTPSMSEVSRVATALRLQSFLSLRGLDPCVVALWPGLPASLDTSSRATLDRDGVASSEPLNPDLDSIHHLVRNLTPTGFTDGVKELLESCFEGDPQISKIRMLMHLLGSRNVIALPALDISLPGIQVSDHQRSTLSMVASFEVLCASFPVTCVVHPSLGVVAEPLLSSDTIKDLGVVLFPSVNATLVETKVERWLEKFDMAPEAFMGENFRVDSVLASMFPGDVDTPVASVREDMMQRIFHLQFQLRERGFNEDKVLDKLAVQLDQQLDQLRGHARKVAESERDVARQQLSKVRQYLRPSGVLQPECMSLLHYLNFYGPDVVKGLMGALELGDNRHHLVYLGN